MSVKSYKLIPTHIFEKMECSQKQGIHNSGKNEENRSVRDIVQENLADTQFSPSTHYVADFKLSPKKGGFAGNMYDQKVPVFMPNSRELPRYSRGFKLKKSLDKISDILESDELSDDLKIKIYGMLKRKYDDVRNIDGNFSENEDADIDDGVVNDRAHKKNKSKEPKSAGMSTLTDIVKKLPAKKNADGRMLADFLIRHTGRIKWDVYGNIFYPKLNGIESLDLLKLFKAVLYKDYNGSHDDVELAAKVLYPFRDELLKRGIIANPDLISKFGVRDNIQKLSKYVSW